MQRLILICLLTAVTLAAPPFTASVSQPTIAVGESAVVTLAGGQADVPGENTMEMKMIFWSKGVHPERIDRTHFAVKGLAPCDCVLTFNDGKSKASVKIRVVKK